MYHNYIPKVMLLREDNESVVFVVRFVRVLKV